MAGRFIPHSVNKLRYFRRWKAHFVTVGIISTTIIIKFDVTPKNRAGWKECVTYFNNA